VYLVGFILRNCYIKWM